MPINNILNNSLLDQSGGGAFAGTEQPAFLTPTADNFIDGYSTTVTAAGTTTLTFDSNKMQFFTGTNTQTVVMPDVTTLILGQSFFIVNNSSNAVTIESSGSNVIAEVGAGANAIITCIALTGATDASWNAIVNEITPPASFPWTVVSGTSQACSNNNGYISNNAGQTTFTAPASCAIGDRIIIKGVGAGGWIMTANTGQTIRFGQSVTSTAGTVTSAAAHDSFQMTCIVADTVWSIDYAVSAGLDLV